MCPLRPPLFWRSQGQVTWSDCVREGKTRKSPPRGLTPSSVSVFHCQHLRSSVLRPASGRALRFVRERGMSELREKMAIRDNLIYRWETPPITAFCSSWISHSVSPPIINFFLTPFDLYHSLLLFNNPPTISLFVKLSRSASLSPVLVRSKSIHPSRQHREDRLMPAQSSERRSDQLSRSQSMPYLSEIPPSIPHSPFLSQHVPPSLVYDHELSSHAPTE